MKQIYLVCYLEAKGCEVIRVSNKGYYVIRRKDDYTKISGIPVPTGGEFLKEETVCRICNTLGVEIPPTSQEEINKMMVWIQEDVTKKINNGNF